MHRLMVLSTVSSLSCLIFVLLFQLKSLSKQTERVFEEDCVSNHLSLKRKGEYILV